MDLIKQLAQELSLRESQVAAAVKLIDEGNTIPFIARYRKEATGSLDDTQLRDLFDRLAYLRSLEKRKEEVRSAIETAGALTPELEKALETASTLAQVEDIYRPYKPKRRTRGSMARERGLEPLAQLLLRQNPQDDPLTLAAPFADPEKELPAPEDALAGARDIVAEDLSDSAAVRADLREYLWKNALLQSKGKTEENSTYSMYYDFTSPVKKLAGYQVLALDRGEREEFLKVTLSADENYLLALTLRHILKRQPSPCGEELKAAAADSLSRLILPSLEREIRSQLTETAANQAIDVFALNLRHLLMQPPVKGKVALGLDPAYRTGCKIAVVDATGRVLETAVVYPTPPQNKKEEAKQKLKQMIQRHGVSVIAIGNGTASKESEIFVAELIKELPFPVSYLVVSEAGASVYSASQLAAEEFPQYDVSLRSAVSIARRLQDPLAELVKIDPKAIGVGQYQHDMPKKQLDNALTGVVEDCVNAVGVDANTASHSLLSYVAGIGGALAKNIVAYREENGAFTSRKELLKVPKLGKKAYEQCAGFLRVPESDNLLDRTAVHPESYDAAQKLLAQCGYQKGEEDFSGLRQRVNAIGLETLAQQLGIGVPTLSDIIEELLKPGRDPRDTLPPPLLRSDLLDIKDLKPGMVLQGTVRNVIDFGAFVDIGVHQDGLVHISRITDRFIKHPSQVVKVGDIVKVKVLEVDLARKRISLTMRDVDSPSSL